MLNKLFQFLWFKIITHLYNRKEPISKDILLENYAPKMLKCIEWSDLFGGADLVIIGDSNGETLTEQKTLSEFPQVTIDLAIGGTRADHWSEFFSMGRLGYFVYKAIKKKKVVINLGGNNVLQNKVKEFENALKTLLILFPKAYFINIPSIYVDFISSISGKSREEIINDIEKVNSTIEKNVSILQRIDIRKYTGSDEGTPYFFVLKDAVHYSTEFDLKIRIPLIKRYVYGK